METGRDNEHSNSAGEDGSNPTGMRGSSSRLLSELTYYRQVDASRTQHLNNMDIAELRRLASSQQETQQNSENSEATSIANVYHSLFIKTGQIQDLDHAILQASNELLADSSVEYGPRLRDLVVMLITKFQHTDTLSHLQEAIFRAQEMVAMTPAEHADRSSRIADWIRLMVARFESTGLEDDLDEARFSAQQVGAQIEVEKGEGVVALKVLVPALDGEGSYGKRPSVESDKTAVTEDGLALFNIDPESSAAAQPTSELELLDKLVSMFYEEDGSTTKDEPFQNEAILRDLQELAVWARNPSTLAQHNAHQLDPDVRSEICRLNLLSVNHGRLFEAGGSITDLEAAISLAERCLAIAPLSYSDRPCLLNNLGYCLGRRAEELNSTADLDRAIEACREATETAAHGYPELGLWLRNYGYMLGTRFMRTGNLEDLDQAIELSERAVVSATPGDGRVHDWETSLAVWLRRRFQRLGMANDIDRAIQVSERAAAHRSNPNDRAGRLANLAHCLEERYRRMRNLDDLNRGIAAIREAVRLYLPGRQKGKQPSLSGSNSPPSQQQTRNHPHSPGALIGLANLLAIRSKLGVDEGGTSDDLDEAIDAEEEAIALVPNDYHDRAGWMSNLSVQLSDRFMLKKSLADLDRAIEVGSQAVAVMDPSHRDRGRALNILGNCHMKRSATGSGSINDPDINQALDRYKEAWVCPNTDPTMRISIAQNAANILAMKDHWAESSTFLEDAVKLLPRVSPRSLQNTDKQAILSSYSGLASLAAAAALNAGKPPEHALQLLELGRGVIAGLLMEMRLDISDLEDKFPALAEKFENLREELDAPAAIMMADTSSAGTQVRRRLEADKEFDQLLDQIRAKSGFENFLRPSPAEMRAAGDPDPIVVVNLSRFRCDAFLVQRDDITVLELPGLTPSEAETHVRRLRETIEGSPLSGIAPPLEWLWDIVARPCLDALGFTRHAQDDADGKTEWPRVWWVPTGVLSQLPLHAAGRYYLNQPGSVDGDTVLDRVMSSYASSVSMLIRGRRLHDRASPVPPSNQALLVAMEETPGLPLSGLPFAKDEVDMLTSLCPSLHLEPVRPQSRKDDVLEHLATCHIFHFAGHGRSDAREPSRSCLLLKDWETSALTVSDLRDRRLQVQKAENPLPFLGYLSACSTSANEAEGLVDESIHLVSALQLAGFRHVIGTLWEVSDEHCVDVARVLYHTMRDEGMTNVAVCRGLHKAVRELRDGQIKKEQNARKIEAEGGRVREIGRTNAHWVPYVHFGV
ncbi:hypothetical protein BHE90_008560 [Fusarium euwallaceae]|uniref:CHAT domain-containing protein n=1 Tax=Fusarium euwallaceae TaxID=1147111 RepID=A0A430LMN0_9HYPO|nr:hypothetical protein BHE90_008560 [Fusarium euwallaceae]